METCRFEIKFTVPGAPVGKGRPRVTRCGTFTPKKTRDYEEKVRRCWQTQSGVSFPAGTPILAKITAWFPIPKSTSKKRAAQMAGGYHIKRPDCDNIAKAILDSLNGCAYPDDSAVQLRVEKRYTTAASRVDVVLWEVQSND